MAVSKMSKIPPLVRIDSISYPNLAGSRKRKQTDIQDIAVVKKFVHSTPTKDSLMQEKKGSFSLSSNKLVHARDEDSEDTLVIRSIYPDCSENLRCFGIKGIDNIKHLFLAVLDLIGTTSTEEIFFKPIYKERQLLLLLLL